MSTAGILRADEVVFYHPLDDFDESTLGQTWTGTAAFAAGKLPGAGPIGLSSVTGSAFAFGANDSVSASTTLVVPSIIDIDGTRALVRYKTTGFLSAVRVVTVSGTVTTSGPELSLGNGDQWSAAALTKLSSTKFVVITRYSQTANTFARVLTVSGVDVTAGPSVTYYNGIPTFPITQPIDSGSIGTLDSTRVIVAYGLKNPGLEIQALIGTVSGSEITFGTTYSIDTTAVDFTSQIVLTTLSSTKAVAIWERDSGSGAELTSIVMTVSGNDITVGAVTLISSGQNPHSWGICALDSTRVVVAARFLTGAVKYTIRVGTVSGTDVTYDSAVAIGITTVLRCFKIDTDKVIVASRLGSNAACSVETFSISGTTPTSLGSSTFDSPTTASAGQSVGVLSASKIVCTSINASGDATFVVAGELGLGSDLTAPTPGAYPSIIGDTRVVAAFWSINPTAGSTTIDIERGYKVTLTSSTISLGGTTAVWNVALGVDDGGDHLIVLDFEHQSGTTWNLRTSVDGVAFTNQGTQDSGTQVVATTDTDPNLTLSNASGGTQWIDELTMWSGDKATFAMFTSEELANMYDLADTFAEEMNQYEQNYGAPICWQATATMPDGTVWRDSGSGPCPAVIRAPNGATNIIVTDNGMMITPRIMEG